MKTVLIPEDYQHTSPAGAEVRVLLNNVVSLAQISVDQIRVVRVLIL